MGKLRPAGHAHQPEFLPPRDPVTQLHGKRAFAHMTILAFPTAIMFDYHPIPAGLSADQFPRLRSLFEILLGAIPRHRNDPWPGRNNVGAAIERPKVTNGKILTLVPVICTETASVIGCFLVALLCIGKIDDPAIVIQHAFQRFGKTAIRRHLRKCGRGNCNECGGYKKPKNWFFHERYKFQKVVIQRGPVQRYLNAPGPYLPPTIHR